MGMNVDIVKAKDGTDILVITQNGSLYRLNSTYKPYEEATKFASQFCELSDKKLLLVFGYGNGIIPEAIRTEFDGTIVFYEPSGEIIESLRGIKYPCICNGKDTFFVAPDNCLFDDKSYKKSEFSLLLESLITYANYNDVIYCALPKYKELFSDEYNVFAEYIEYRINKLKGNIETAKLMGEEAVENNIINMKYIADSFCADDFVDRFPKDIPAIIVSAGPSLAKNIHMIREAKGKALIICVDTAIKYMLEFGELPDCIISVDPRVMLPVFNDERLAGIPILASFETNHAVLDKLNSLEIIFISTENTYIKKFYEKAGHRIERLRSGGSVSTMAFSLCVYWGFQNIILIGQDLALTGSKMYADDEGIKMDQSGKQLLEVEDIDGNTVATYSDFYGYLKWFEQEIQLLKEVNVIDATEGGAKIKGCSIMTFENAIKQYCKASTTDILQIGDIRPAFDDIEKDKVRTTIIESIAKLEELDCMLMHGMELLKNNRVSKEINEVDKEIERICSFYEDMDESYIIQRQIDATMLEEFVGIFEGEIISSRDRYERLYKYFDCLRQAVTVVKRIWNQIYE